MRHQQQQTSRDPFYSASFSAPAIIQSNGLWLKALETQENSDEKQKAPDWFILQSCTIALMSIDFVTFNSICLRKNINKEETLFDPKTDKECSWKRFKDFNPYLVSFDLISLYVLVCL